MTTNSKCLGIWARKLRHLLCIFLDLSDHAFLSIRVVELVQLRPPYVTLVSSAFDIQELPFSQRLVLSTASS